MKLTKHQLQELAPKVRRLFTHDWEAKLVALVLAFLVWYIVKDQVARGRKFPVPDGWGKSNATARL